MYFLSSFFRRLFFRFAPTKTAVRVRTSELRGRQVGDALNSARRSVTSGECALQQTAAAAGGRRGTAATIRHDYVTPKCDRTALRKLAVAKNRRAINEEDRVV